MTLPPPYLKRMGYKLGTVTDPDGFTGLKRRRIHLSGLQKYFDVVVVAGEDCPHQKPNKEPFLMAARKLHVPPRNCVMIGDSVSKDIEGALTAGMKTVLVKQKNKAAPSKKTHVVGRLTDLRGLLLNRMEAETLCRERAIGLGTGIVVCVLLSDALIAGEYLLNAR
jgi:FMN phosphatase YigB (HAD superfamily)